MQNIHKTCLYFIDFSETTSLILEEYVEIMCIITKCIYNVSGKIYVLCLFIIIFVITQ